MRLHLLLACLALPFLTPHAPASSATHESAPPVLVTDDDADDEVLDEIVDGSGKIGIDGVAVPYDFEAGRLVLRDEDGTPRAHMFHVAYTRSDVSEPTERPVMFCFNGGPGSSSVWLHLGLYGPRRVDLGEEGFDLSQPYDLVDNAHSVLDVADLVFIDPVTTGYSRAADGVDDSDFHGQQQDVESVGQFIHLWLTRNGRWASPVYISGESYGTTRAAALALHLQDRYGVYPRGLVLVSAILNFQTARFDVGNDLPYVLFLPTYAATAWFHGKLDAELSANPEATLAEVEEFALGDYATALMHGDRLSDENRAEVAARLARYTGLDQEYIESTNLRIHIGRFCKELRRDERITVGRLDSRYTGVDRDAAGERYEFDPSMAAIDGPYSTLLNHYVRNELGFESDLPYEILTGRVHPWDYSNVENQYLNVAEDLRRAMTSNPNLRVHVANGYYDLATPYFATHYTFDHMFLEPADRERITMGHFQSGHMMYVQRQSLFDLRTQLLGFLKP
ncbi:MAG: S10 family peptidase [Planctomycetota bacterium]|jgi:carboxypeptidase C (cathepsin A)